MSDHRYKMESVGTDIKAEKQAYNCFSLLNGATVTQNTTETTLSTLYHSEDDVIATFAFDYALMEDFKIAVGWATRFRFFVAPAIVRFLPALRKCFLRRRVQWDVYSQHLCITRDGIRFICDLHKTFWGCTATVNQGKTSKFIAFDTISECDIEERKGHGCMNTLNSLTCIVLDNASNNSSEEKGIVNALVIFGLTEPQKFKELLLALKNSDRKYGKNGTITIPLTDALVKPFGTTDENEVCSRCTSCFVADTFCGVTATPSQPDDATTSAGITENTTCLKSAPMLQWMCCGVNGSTNGGIPSPIAVPMRA
jgi:hypothetical protein